MNLSSYRTVGRSGLVVSPLALGTMTFGPHRWGSADGVSTAVLDAYVEEGGNFIDTADVYAGGHSEELLGNYVADRSLRDRLVLATKFAFQGGGPGNPNGGGNGRKNIHRALESSLRRLRTDYIDLYWLHIWDTVTPAEEVLETFGDLTRAGKIRYFALSNVPAWYAVRLSTLATARGVPGPIALQLEYSLVERGIEREHMPGAFECGIGICPWSPLGGGFLTGKYSRDRDGDTMQGRLSGTNPFGNSKFNDRNWEILETLRQVAAEVDRSPAQVALAWLLGRAGVCSVVAGASNLDQLRENVASVGVSLASEQTAKLNDSSSAPADNIVWDRINRMIFGGGSVPAWR